MRAPSQKRGSVYEQILDRILDGRLEGGAIVQERQLAEELGISRTPLREALGRLQGEGYVRKQGRSHLVANISVKEIIDVLNLRRLLESEAIRLCIGNISEAKIEELLTSLQDLEEAAPIDKVHHRNVDDEIHIAIARASSNEKLLKYIMELRNNTRMFNFAYIPERFEPGQTEHREILEAIRAGDADRAERAMRTHIENAKTAIIDKLK